MDKILGVSDDRTEMGTLPSTRHIFPAKRKNQCVEVYTSTYQYIILEEIFKLMLEVKDESNGTFVRDDEKITRNGASIWHMMTCGRIPNIVDMEVDETRMKSISSMTHDNLVISSEEWRTKYNLPNFGVILENASLFRRVIRQSQ